MPVAIPGGKPRGLQLEQVGSGPGDDPAPFAIDRQNVLLEEKRSASVRHADDNCLRLLVRAEPDLLDPAHRSVGGLDYEIQRVLQLPCPGGSGHGVLVPGRLGVQPNATRRAPRQAAAPFAASYFERAK